MRSYRTLLLGIVGLLLMVVGMRQVAVNSSSLGGYEQIVDLCFTGEGICTTDIQSMQQGEEEATLPLIDTLVGWREVADITYQEETLGRQVTGKEVTYVGNINLLLRKEKNPTSFWLTSRSEVIITSALAEALWGDADNVGKTIHLEDTQYTVIGSVEDTERVLYHLGDISDTFAYMRLDLTSNQQVAEDMGQIGMRYGFPAHHQLNRALESNLLRLVAGVVCGVVLLLIMLLIVKAIISGKENWLVAILAYSVLCVVLFLFIRSLLAGGGIPQELLPNKWSDFSFFEKLWTQFRDYGVLQQQMAKNSQDMAYRMLQQNMMGGMALGVIGIGCVLRSIYKLG